jgi:hypothetical protein
VWVIISCQAVHINDRIAPIEERSVAIVHSQALWVVVRVQVLPLQAHSVHDRQSRSCFGIFLDATSCPARTCGHCIEQVHLDHDLSED